MTAFFPAASCAVFLDLFFILCLLFEPLFFLGSEETDFADARFF
jgi:hypothetical protein